MLIVCPTPIGNLEDATPRQREALTSADVIACEDTRTTGKLLELLGIARVDGRPRLVSYHEHNEQKRAEELVASLLQGTEVVLVSDAGTPAISDPGYRLVRAARQAGVEVTVLPGPNAAIVALAGSGIPTDRFSFEGFLPSKQGQRVAALEASRGSGTTRVFYESPKRVVDVLGAIGEVYGDVEVCVARELTKIHEEWLFGTAAAIAAELAKRDRVRGEFVIVVGPDEPQPSDDVDAWIEAMWAEGVAPAAIKAVVARAAGMSKSEVWTRLEALKGRAR